MKTYEHKKKGEFTDCGGHTIRANVVVEKQLWGRGRPEVRELSTVVCTEWLVN